MAIYGIPNELHYMTQNRLLMSNILYFGDVNMELTSDMKSLIFFSSC